MGPNWVQMGPNWVQMGVTVVPQWDTVGIGGPDPYHGVPPWSAPSPYPTTPGTHPPPAGVVMTEHATRHQPDGGSPGFFWIQSSIQNTDLSKSHHF